MSRDWESLSAYFDGELDSDAAIEVERLIEQEEDAKALFRRFSRVHERLHGGPRTGGLGSFAAGNGETAAEDIDLSASSARTWHRIQARIAAFADYERAGLPDARDARRRGLTLPMPLAVAASLLLIVSFTAAVWLAARQSPAPALASSTAPVNVTIEVDDFTAEGLVRWLQEEDMLGELTVNLPSSPQFRMRGEPQLIKVEDRRSALETAP